MPAPHEAGVVKRRHVRLLAAPQDWDAALQQASECHCSHPYLPCHVTKGTAKVEEGWWSNSLQGVPDCSVPEGTRMLMPLVGSNLHTYLSTQKRLFNLTLFNITIKGHGSKWILILELQSMQTYLVYAPHERIWGASSRANWWNWRGNMAKSNSWEVMASRLFCLKLALILNHPSSSDSSLLRFDGYFLYWSVNSLRRYLNLFV